MRKEKKIPEKKAYRLPLASMSIHWKGNQPKKASMTPYEINRLKRKARQKATRKPIK